MTGKILKFEAAPIDLQGKASAVPNTPQPELPISVFKKHVTHQMALDVVDVSDDDTTRGTRERNAVLHISLPSIRLKVASLRCEFNGRQGPNHPLRNYNG